MMYNIILTFSILFLVLIGVASGRSQNEAAKVIDAASACYRSLPDHAQKDTARYMLEARKHYNDGINFIKNNDKSISIHANTYFNNAANSAYQVIGMGRAYNKCK